MNRAQRRAMGIKTPTIKPNTISVFVTDNSIGIETINGTTGIGTAAYISPSKSLEMAWSLIKAAWVAYFSK